MNGRYARTTPRRREARGYVTGYLKSVEWFRRRDRWFEEEERRSGRIVCPVCMKDGRRREFELHHVDYTGVTQRPDGRWEAGEEHDDLVALHPRCHEWVHRGLDTDQAAAAASDRRAANIRIIAGLRNRILTYLKGL